MKKLITSLAQMTPAQQADVLAAAQRMLANFEDYCPQIAFAAIGSFWNEATRQGEAWLTDGNANMHAAVKFERLCTLSPVPPSSIPTASLRSLRDWVNQHDCGVTPTAIFTPAGSALVIRTTAIGPDRSETIETATVKTYREARNALGY